MGIAQHVPIRGLIPKDSIKRQHGIPEPLEATGAQNAESKSAVAGADAGSSCTHRAILTDMLFNLRAITQ